jgi:hypothetical protein
MSMKTAPTANESRRIAFLTSYDSDETPRRAAARQGSGGDGITRLLRKYVGPSSAL